MADRINRMNRISPQSHRAHRDYYQQTHTDSLKVSKGAEMQEIKEAYFLCIPVSLPCLLLRQQAAHSVGLLSEINAGISYFLQRSQRSYKRR
jgi:hypothetical protein